MKSIIELHRRKVVDLMIGLLIIFLSIQVYKLTLENVQLKHEVQELGEANCE